MLCWRVRKITRSLCSVRFPLRRPSAIHEPQPCPNTRLNEMKSRITIPIDGADYAVFADAVRILRRKLGAKTPTVEVLIQFELSHRDPQMIADDYLETHTLRPRFRVVARRRLTPGVDCGNLRPLSARAIARGYSAPCDPSRN